MSNELLPVLISPKKREVHGPGLLAFSQHAKLFLVRRSGFYAGFIGGTEAARFDLVAGQRPALRLLLSLRGLAGVRGKRTDQPGGGHEQRSHARDISIRQQRRSPSSSRSPYVQRRLGNKQAMRQSR
ncbi:MAG: hypothetical protein U5K38_02985 [Woeseiaceae bacterium]|nr:hypothetical protein [Woeseiaceae bacterium]